MSANLKSKGPHEKEHKEIFRSSTNSPTSQARHSTAHPPLLDQISDFAANLSEFEGEVAT
jgi:hypothetical protein